MAKLTIRCHPLTPAGHRELEAWLENQASHIRGADPKAIVRLSRLTQELPSGEMGIGWVLELDLVKDLSSISERLAFKLDEAIRDMRLLGLQPVTLAPLEPAESPPSERRPAITRAT
jgi:hypothetical protein